MTRAERIGKDIVDKHCPVLDILRNPTPVRLSLRRDTVAAAAAE